MQLSKLLSYEANEGGKWEDFGGGLKLLIAPLGTQTYDDAAQKIMRTNPGSIKLLADEKDSDKAKALEHEINCEAMADAIILDWKGLLDDDGKKVAYSPSTAKEILIKCYPLYKSIAAVARQMSMENVALFKNAEKN